MATLEARVGDFSERGLARRPGQSFAELYEERLALYARHAEITINCAAATQEAVCYKIIKEIDA